MRHELKTWPEYFESILSGDKTFEVRKNDRDFKVGDIISLKEWNPATGIYTGRESQRRISYILTGGQFGIEERYVVMGLSEKPF